MEAAELATLLEEKWGVSAAAPVAAVAAGPAAGVEAPAEAKDEFDVILTSSQGDKKIRVIKEVRGDYGSRSQRSQGSGRGRAEAAEGRRAAGRGKRRSKAQIEEAGGQVDVK